MSLQVQVSWHATRIILTVRRVHGEKVEAFGILDLGGSVVDVDFVCHCC